jgi:hypothetical protein
VNDPATPMSRPIAVGLVCNRTVEVYFIGVCLVLAASSVTAMAMRDVVRKKTGGGSRNLPADVVSQASH